jgi:PKD repeat protein
MQAKAVAMTADGMLAYGYGQGVGSPANDKGWYGKVKRSGYNCKSFGAGGGFAVTRGLVNNFGPSPSLSNITLSSTPSTFATSPGTVQDSLICVCTPPASSFGALPNGLTVQFTDGSAGQPTAWLWDFGDGGSSSVQHPSHTYGSAGTYTVCLTVTNACGTNMQCVPVTVCSPTGFLSVGPNQAVCAGASATFTASPGFSAYLWTTGATTGSITVSAAGTYGVTATDAGGCASTASVTLTVNPLPGVTVSASNGGNICFGASTVTLTATGGLSGYAWSGGGSANTKVVSTSGTYTVTVTDANGCTATGSYVVTDVSSCRAPSVMGVGTVTANSAFLNWDAVPCAASYTIQYRKVPVLNWTTVTSTTNSKLITGLQANKAYHWRVSTTCTGGGGTSAYSPIGTFTTPTNKMGDLDSVAAVMVAPVVYPNPNDGSFMLEYVADGDGPVQICALDLYGKLVYCVDRDGQAGENVWEMDMGDLAKGVYLLRIVSEMRVAHLRLVVE